MCTHIYVYIYIYRYVCLMILFYHVHVYNLQCSSQSIGVSLAIATWIYVLWSPVSTMVKISAHLSEILWRRVSCPHLPLYDIVRTKSLSDYCLIVSCRHTHTQIKGFVGMPMLDHYISIYEYIHIHIYIYIVYWISRPHEYEHGAGMITGLEPSAHWIVCHS